VATEHAIAQTGAAGMSAALDDFVERARYSHFMQTAAWARAFAEERETFDTVATQDERGALCACSRVRRVRGAFRVGAKCFVDGGPVFDDEHGLELHLRDLLSAARAASFLRVRPYVPAGDCRRLRQLLGDYAFTFPPPARQSGYRTTLVLDLSRSPESLHAAFSAGLRRNLRRSARDGLRIERTVAGPEIAAFAAMLARTAAGAGYDVPSASRVAAYLESVCATSPPTAALFCARLGTRLMAGIVVLRAGGSLVYQWGARADPAQHGGQPLAHALHWEAIQWARTLALRTYDFGGLWGDRANNGIDRFKHSFGGEIQEMFGEAIRTRGLVGRLVSTDAARLVSRLRAAAARFRTRRASHVEAP
jgi:Acetyltransferase (GNAT) domain